MSATRDPRPFTGRRMAAIMIAFFAVVIAVNLAMARLASRSFSGIVVGNSYEASQNFNRWLDEAAREKALAWDATAARTGAGRLAISIAPDGATPIPARAALTAEARRPLGPPDDRTVHFLRTGDGTWLSTTSVKPGRWKLRLRLDGRDAGGNAVVWRDEVTI